jgi:3-dehydro-L-gulonate-6-phosphate decarboxylase
MKLQVSFDIPDLDKALNIAHEIIDHVDIFELGLLLIYKHGIHAVETFRKAFPEKVLLVDLKLIARGYDAIPLFAQAGANWVTVLAGASQNAIHATCNEASKYNMRAMIDLLDAPTLGQSALEAKNVGASALIFYQPYDDKEALIYLDNWDMIRGNTDLPIFIAGKIKRSNVKNAIKVKPDGIIIGRSIMEAENPLEEVKFFRDVCNNN